MITTPGTKTILEKGKKKKLSRQQSPKSNSYAFTKKLPFVIFPPLQSSLILAEFFISHISLSPTLHLSFVTSLLPSLLRSLPRQTLDTVTDILERLLVLLARVLALVALDLLAVVPLHLERAEHDARVEAVDVVVRVAGEAGELLDEVEEGVDVIATEKIAKY